MIVRVIGRARGGLPNLEVSAYVSRSAASEIPGQGKQAGWLRSTTMSSSSRDATGHQNPIDDDDPMLGAAEEEEEGEDQPGDTVLHDSSEEEEEDEEEERRIRDGFIVDEDEDEDAEGEDASDRKRRRKRRKRRHRRGTSCNIFAPRCIL